MLAVESDFAKWLETWAPLYGPAATAELHAQQQLFARTFGEGDPADLYQRTIGRTARHTLGEYFTPPALAGFVLGKLGFTGRGTLLDPSAGLGVFLTTALDCGATPSQVRGFELNPLTAACARARGLDVATRDTLCDTPDARFDWIAGNPPWVNWRHLHPACRQRIAPLWHRYELLPTGGIGARLGAGMDDLSILFTYVCADRLLAPGGRMGLLLSRTLLQSSGGGRAFRRFKLPHNRVLNVLEVHEIAPGAFPGATTQTVLILFETREARRVFPVPWFRDGERWNAEPVSADPASPWAVNRNGDLHHLRGRSAYRARIGVHSGGASGVYWVDIVERRESTVVIRNRHNAGRTKWPEVTAEVESGLVRRLIRGRDVRRWSVQPSAHILLPHTADGRPIEHPDLRDRYPLTFQYFEQFCPQMLERAHYLRHFAPLQKPYWSLYNVGPYTFAPHRIVWREQSREFECAVLEDSEAIPDAKLIVVPCASAEEARYLAALLNSTPAREFIHSFRIHTQTSTHILEHLRVPQFDSRDPVHSALSMLAGLEHQAAIDERAGEIWQLG